MAKRKPRKKGQRRNSKEHSDLYTDENPEGTIHGLKFATVKDSEASVRKIKRSNRSHNHKTQAAVAMEQRAEAAGKKSSAAVYRKFIEQQKEKTEELRESIRHLLLRQYSNRERLVERRDSCPGVNPYIKRAIDYLKRARMSVTIKNDGKKMVIKFLDSKGTKIGVYRAEKSSAGRCYGAWITTWSNVDEDFEGLGLGALLYDIAIEEAGEDGLSPDRDSVSDDAIRMWKYFRKNTYLKKSDYTAKPYDDPIKQWTETKKDDCGGWSWEAHDWGDFKKYMDFKNKAQEKKLYQDHFLNNVYVKKNQARSTIKCLIKNKVLAGA